VIDLIVTWLFRALAMTHLERSDKWRLDSTDTALLANIRIATDVTAAEPNAARHRSQLSATRVSIIEAMHGQQNQRGLVRASYCFSVEPAYKEPGKIGIKLATG
jgi:hypothetical protein